MHRAHKIRMYPTRQQQEKLWCAIAMQRYAFNWGVAKWNELWQAHKADHRKPKPSYVLLSRLWTKEKPQWANKVARAVVNRTLRDLAAGWTRFFKRVTANPPSFRKKRPGRGSFYIQNAQGGLKGCSCKVPDVGWIKLAEKLRFEGKIVSYTVSTNAGQWYVSVRVQISQSVHNMHNSVVGVDVGLENHPAYASDGTQLILPLEKLHKLQRKYKSAQRAFSRSQKNSNNRNKRRLKKQKIQQKITNIRLDATHKFTAAVAKNHGIVVIQDLHMQPMIRQARGRKLKAAFRSSLKTYIHWQLSYKAEKIIKAPRFFPSSKTCSNCGAIKSELPPEIRVYKCEHCGAVLDRDYNAALNLMKLGLVKPE